MDACFKVDFYFCIQFFYYYQWFTYIKTQIYFWFVLIIIFNLILLLLNYKFTIPKLSTKNKNVTTYHTYLRCHINYLINQFIKLGTQLFNHKSVVDVETFHNFSYTSTFHLLTSSHFLPLFMHYNPEIIFPYL